MKVKFLEQTAGVFRRKSLVEGGGTMGVEIVHDDSDTGGLWIDLIDQVAHDVGKIHLGALLGDFHVTPTSQWFYHHEQVPRAVALIFVVHSLDLSRTGR